MVRRTASRVLQPQAPQSDFNPTANPVSHQSCQLPLTAMPSAVIHRFPQRFLAGFPNWAI